MKRKFLSVLLSLAVCMSTTTMSANAQAGYFNEYTTVYDAGSTNECTSMQGMCMDKENGKVYYIKKNDNDTKAMISRMDVSSKKKNDLKQKTSSGKNSTTSDLYHANDMEFVRIDGKAYLFVVTCSDSATYNIIKLYVKGNTYKKVASYKVKKTVTVKKNGKKVKEKQKVSVSGISLIGENGDNLNFMMKKGSTIYKATIGKSLKNKKTIMLSSGCKLNLKKSKINGKKISNIGKYLSQGFTYHNGKVFTPYTYENKSVIFVFSVDGNGDLPKSVVGDTDLSFRITSKAFSLFEIESCAIAKDGKLYFNCNTNGTDKIAYFKNKSQTFEF